MGEFTKKTPKMRQEQEFLQCTGVNCACVTAEKEPTRALRTTENIVTKVADVLGSCDWRQAENLTKNETKMGEVPGFKERRHTWVEIQAQIPKFRAWQCYGGRKGGI